MHTPNRMKKKDMVRALSSARRARLKKHARDCKHNVWALMELAEIDAKGAASDLYETAASLTGYLTYLCEKNPARFRAIARQKDLWPVTYGPHRDSAARANKLIKTLQVGAGTGLNFSSGKRFSLIGPANLVAMRLHRLAKSLPQTPRRSSPIGDYGALIACGLRIGDEKYEKAKQWRQRGAGKSLPLLSRQTADHWAEAGRELFRIVYPGEFEQDPDLQELRASVEGRATPKHAKPGRPGDIRKAMLQAVKQAWSSIAALD
jgi:hypothetical protein